jgi:hypothetical protein
VTSPKQRPLPANSHHSQQRDILFPGGIRTCNPGNDRPQTHAFDETTALIGYTETLFVHLINSQRWLFGRKEDNVTGEWRKVYNEKLNDLYYSLIII